MAERVERWLTTILSADVAEYNRLMRADEDATLALLARCRDLAAVGIGEPDFEDVLRQGLAQRPYLIDMLVRISRAHALTVAELAIICRGAPLQSFLDG